MTDFPTLSHTSAGEIPPLSYTCTVPKACKRYPFLGGANVKRPLQRVPLRGQLYDIYLFISQYEVFNYSNIYAQIITNLYRKIPITISYHDFITIITPDDVILTTYMLVSNTYL